MHVPARSDIRTVSSGIGFVETWFRALPFIGGGVGRFESGT